MVKNHLYNSIIIVFAVALGMCFFAGGAQFALAAESIPVQVYTYENGNLDDTELVWEGSYTPPSDKSVPITKAAEAFASKAPEGYSFGIASVKKAIVDTSIYQVEEIDGSAGIYRLADFTTYNISNDDVLAFYFYRAEVEVPVYWCQYNVDGTLMELSDREYRAVSGSEIRVKSITVPDDNAASLGPIETADVVTAMRNADETGIATYVVGRDGLLGSPLFDASLEESPEDDADQKVVYRMGGESTEDSAYKVDSDGLLLQNTSTGVAFSGIGLAGLKGNTEEIDLSNPVVSPAEYEMISGSLPAVYVVYENQSSIVPLASGAPGEEGHSMALWLLAAAAVTLVLILIVVAYVRKRA